MTTNSPALCFSNSSSTGILRALPESSLLAAMRDNFAVDVAEIRSMNRLQLLRMADACRFLSNNLPTQSVSAK
jgi:hypothetical protein